MGFIYLIQNDINDHVYVGQTRHSIDNRWKQHCYASKRSDTILYRAMRKYGIEHFSITEIEQCDNSLLDERERYWIKHYNSYGNGYNMTLGGEGAHTVNYNEIFEHFQNNKNIYQTARELNVGKTTVRRYVQDQNIEYDRDRSQPKKIVMIDPKTLQPLHHYNSIAEAANSHDSWQRETIRDAVSGRRLSAYGYFWKIEGSDKQFSKTLYKHKHRVAQLDPITEQVINVYESIAAAARAIGKPKGTSGISNAAAGKAKTAYNYKWKFIND